MEFEKQEIRILYRYTFFVSIIGYVCNKSLKGETSMGVVYKPVLRSLQKLHEY